MAVPYYTYLVLKMPSPIGVLSLQGDLKISFDCDTKVVEFAATNQVPNAMMEIYVASKKLAPSELDIQRSRTQPTSLSHLRKCKSRRSILGQATTARLP
jgi:hypothetical protein